MPSFRRGNDLRQRSALLIATLLWVAGCSGGTARDDGEASRHNLLLITVDTLRADSLGFDEDGREISPHLNRLAARSLVFEKAYSTAPFTGPAHASMLTSQHPSTHGHIYNGHRAPALLSEKSRTLAEHLGDAGFGTAAFVSAGPLEARFGFSKGFDEFTRVRKTDHEDKGGAARHLNEAAFAWLDARDGKERFFLWLHYFEPHLPYLCAEPVREALGLADHVAATHETVRKVAPEILARAYRAEVFENDLHIGALLSHLAELGLDATTVVAVTADHGEYLGEHGLVDHSRLYDEVLHVPMMIRRPGQIEGKRRQETVSTLDLTPTLLEMLGVDALPGAQGRSLLLRPSPESLPVPVFAEWRHFRMLEEGAEPRPADFQVSVQLGTAKLVRDVLFPERTALFDLAFDPDEEADLKESRPEDFRRLEKLLERHVEKTLPHGILGVEEVRIDDRSKQMLRELGYIE